MGLLSCSVLLSNERSDLVSRSVLSTERSRDESHVQGEGDDRSEEGVVRYYGGGGAETTYDTLPSLHPLRDEMTDSE
jgi:hypothetical protein